jgi:hypothetical protein
VRLASSCDIKVSFAKKLIYILKFLYGPKFSNISVGRDSRASEILG